MSEQNTGELTEGGALDRILGDARKRLAIQRPIDVAWYSWPQGWGDTSCGFGGMAGQALTSAQTTVVLLTVEAIHPGEGADVLNEVALVYHAGRYAYQIEDLTQEFHAMLRSPELPGKRDRFRARKFGKISCVTQSEVQP